MADEFKSDEAAADGQSLDLSGAVMIQSLAVGDKVKIRGGALAEVTANPRDGGWLFVRFLDCPDQPSRVGSEEMVFCVDVLSAERD